MEFKASKLAEILEGKVVGNPDAAVSSLSKIEEGVAKSISFLSNPKYNSFLYTTKASIVIVSKDLILEKEVEPTLIVVEDSYKAFTKLLHFYNSVKNNKVGIEEQVVISKTAILGENIYIGSFTYIGENVRIGNNVKIYPNCFLGDDVEIADNTTLFAGVKIYSDTKIGTHCIVHSGTTIGSDGFGFAPTGNNSYEKIPQIGNVIVENHVEIGASCTIDRATLGSTIIREGVKLDNQIQIAHNVDIGKNSVIAAQTGIAGSTKIGENAMIGGQVGISGHLLIGKNVKIQAQSGISKNVADNAQLYGSPAIDAQQYRKSFVYFRKFPTLVERLELLENKLLLEK